VRENPPVIDEVPVEVKVSKLEDFCKSIEIYEGYYLGSRSQRNKNPGNLKFTSYTKSLGAVDKDSDNFCIFSSYAAGFNALKEFVIAAGENRLRDYKNCTIESFFKIYSDNSLSYANFVAFRLKVPISKKVANLI